MEESETENAITVVLFADAAHFVCGSIRGIFVVRFQRVRSNNVRQAQRYNVLGP
jgi:hypothetical protein